jgi:hypothetical protein
MRCCLNYSGCVTSLHKHIVCTYYSVMYCTSGLVPHTLALKPKRCVPVARFDARIQAEAKDVGGADQLVECLLRRHLLVEPDK